MKKIILASLLGATSLFGIGIGNYQISPEIGVNLALEDSGKGTFAYGGYGRVWLGVSRVVIAPAFKYDVITKKDSLSTAYKNMQIGGLIGFELPIVSLTPYVGASYSDFFGAYDSTASFNYGIKLKIPIVHITLGIDGTYQRPKAYNGIRVDMNRIGATIGFQF